MNLIISIVFYEWNIWLLYSVLEKTFHRKNLLIPFMGEKRFNRSVQTSFFQGYEIAIRPHKLIYAASPHDIERIIK